MLQMFAASLSEKESQTVCFVHGPLFAEILNAWKGSESAACRVRRPLLRRLCAQPLVNQSLEETLERGDQRRQGDERRND